MWLKRLQYAYITGLALWPGLAVLGLQFVPASQEVWVARLPGTLIFLGCLVLLAAVAIYLSFITEVLPFPARWPEAIPWRGLRNDLLRGPEEDSVPDPAATPALPGVFR